MATLSDKQIKREEEFLKDLPRLNLAALFLPPIWGPAHGMWATLLFYPLWIFADNMFYAAWAARTSLSLILAALVFILLSLGTLAFSLVAQPFAAHRAARKGIQRASYIKNQRWWALVSVLVGCLMIVAATYYNLIIRPLVQG